MRKLIDEAAFSNSQAYSFSGWLTKSKLAWPIDDVGLRSGVLMVERLRTFGGKLFAADEHAKRFCDSLSAVSDNDADKNRASIVKDVANEVVSRNRQLLENDLSVVLLGSPGSSDIAKRIVAYAEPIPYVRLASHFLNGNELIVAPNCNVPDASWPIQIKTRSRIAYHLADQHARSVKKSAIGLLLDNAGNVTDTSIANIICVTENGECVSPPRETAFDGISLRVTIELAKRLDIHIQRRNLTIADLQTANHILMTGTTGCVWSVASLNEKRFAAPGQIRILRHLQNAWIEKLGFDFVYQAANSV